MKIDMITILTILINELEDCICCVMREIQTCLIDNLISTDLFRKKLIIYSKLYVLGYIPLQNDIVNVSTLQIRKGA